MEKTVNIIRKSVHEVLDKYLCGELLRDLENELVHDLEWELARAEMEANDGRKED